MVAIALVGMYFFCCLIMATAHANRPRRDWWHRQPFRGD